MIEDRVQTGLERLAEQVSAPPTDQVGAAIARRSARLQRRRQALRTAAAAGLTATIVAAGVWFVGTDEGTDTTTIPDPAPQMAPPHVGAWEPPPPDTGTLPIFTLPGFATATASQDRYPDDNQEYDPDDYVRLFREPGNYSGPTVYVADEGQPLPADDLAEPIDVGGRPAELWILAPDGRTLRWERADGTIATLHSWDLTTDEVLALVAALETGGDLPQGITEQDRAPTGGGERDVRVHHLTQGQNHAEFFVERGGVPLLESRLTNSAWGANWIEHLIVLGRPAVLVHDRGGNTLRGDYAVEVGEDDGWTLTWRHTDDVVVSLSLSDVSRAEVDQIIAGISELDEATWADLVANFPPSG